MIAAVVLSDNKSAIIAEAVASVVDQVDLVVLVDTGITDDTIEIARTVAGGKLRVCKHVWKDFSQARNASLDFARAVGATWALIVDTDERFQWGSLDLHAALWGITTDVVLVAYEDGSYSKEKLFYLLASQKVQFVGPTHEAPIYTSMSTLPTATFSELPKTLEQIIHKRKRDVELLKDWVAHPTRGQDGRWWYYLGDSYHGLGDLPKAVEAFGHCVSLRKPMSDEGAWAAYRQAECLLQLNRPQEALEVCGAGLVRDSRVGELAWMAAVACMRLGWTEQAGCWAHMSASIGLHTGSGVQRIGFSNLSARYELPYDILRFALPPGPAREKAERDFYTAKRTRLGAKSDHEIDVLALSKTCPQRWDLRAMLRPQVIGGRRRDLQLSEEALERAGVPHYHAMNPSFCLHEGEIKVVVRMVNYTIEDNQYKSCDADGRIRTVNLLGVLAASGDGYILSKMRAARDLDTSPRVDTRVLGYEDMRLFSSKGKLWATATVQDRNKDRCEIALLELSDEGDVVKATVQTTGRSVEKNWMPIVGEGDSQWLYELDPTTTRGAGPLAPLAARQSSLALDHLRGGSQVIPFDDGYLCVTHETIFMEGWGCRRIYLHRFVRFDKSFVVTGASPAWTFEEGHYGIEFCSSMLRTWQGELILGYGVEDREAKLLVIHEDEIRKMKWVTCVEPLRCRVTSSHVGR